MRIFAKLPFRESCVDAFRGFGLPKLPCLYIFKVAYIQSVQPVHGPGGVSTVMGLGGREHFSHSTTAFERVRSESSVKQTL